MKGRPKKMIQRSQAVYGETKALRALADTLRTRRAKKVSRKGREENHTEAAEKMMQRARVFMVGRMLFDFPVNYLFSLCEKKS